jgi:hypothetical protein
MNIRERELIRQEKKAVAATKAKEAKEADEWKAGGMSRTINDHLTIQHISDTDEIAKGTSKADLAAAKQAEAGMSCL